ncbi:hypothetical protein AB5J52_47930 [Streptomyces sp. R39]|uniref:LTD domain-containing protein n=1 Tax=Streptomyces sp. R39 TaxID=3238631 RepID=A0AB39R6L4_9ACTN
MAQRLRSRHRPLTLAVVLFSVLAWLGLGSLTHAGAATASGGDFFPVAPAAKIVDTRSSLGVSAALGATSTASFQVLGQGGVPASGVSAVSLDITAANATSSGSYLQMWPDGTTRPYPGSVINFSSSADTSNSAIIAVGSDGKVDVYNSSGTVDVIVSVNGYFTSAAGTTSPGGYVPVTPARIVDTRDGTGAPQATIAPGGTLDVQVDGVDGVTDEASVYANITVPSPGTAGSLYAYATGASPGQPTVSYKSVTTAQGAVVPVGTGGQITLKNGSSTQSINVVIDIYGYFTEAPSGGGSFTAVQDRLLDTRTSTAVAAHSSVSVAVGGNDGIPTTFGAAVLNLTTTSQQNGGFLQVWGTGPTTPPGLSVDNFQASTTTADQVIVAPGTQGAVTIYNDSAGTIQLIVDLQGWFSTDQTPATPDPTNTAPDPTASDPGPKPTGAVTVSAGPTVSDTPAPTVSSASGAATVSGTFTNAAGTGVPNLTVTLTAPDALTDSTSGETTLPVAGTTTTASDGSWSYTLPDPLPSNLQTLADANNGVLNLSATANGYTSDGKLMTATDNVSAGVAEGSSTTQASQDVRAYSTPHTQALRIDTDATALDAPADSDTVSSLAQSITDSADPGADTAALPTYQSLSSGTSISALSANTADGVNYSSVIPLDNVCTPHETLLKQQIQYTTVGEAHAYWDAKASFEYSDSMSSQIGVAVSTDGKGWTISGSVSETKATGVSTGFTGKGPNFARQWRVPINYGYFRVKVTCLHSPTSYSYEIRPLGYKIPSGGYVAKYGKDVSSSDGYHQFLSSPGNRRAIVPLDAYFTYSWSHSMTYTVGATVFGIGISSTTMYNSAHLQKIQAGKQNGEHDIWGAKDRLSGNPRVFYSF